MSVYRKRFGNFYSVQDNEFKNFNSEIIGTRGDDRYYRFLFEILNH